ncbi:MAG: DamX protein [Kiritimatiellia bacterium]|jgi:DamX protein
MSALAVEQVSSNDTKLSESSDDSLSNYGLRVNPFDDTFKQIDVSTINPSMIDRAEPIPFFMGGDRRAVLDELMHLCQFSHNLVAVLGEAGVGKTALVYQAIIELSDSAQCCILRSSIMVSVDDILHQLSQQLGVFVSEETSTDEMMAGIDQYQPSGAHQRVVVVVDDAHHLSADVLAAFVQLLQRQSSSYLHVLLVGDSSLLLRLDALDKGEILAYDIPLCPFSVDELEHYLSFKLSAVGYQGAELFSYDTVQRMWRDTHGIPASVNQLARNLLISQSMSDGDDSRLGLPLGYMAIVVVLLAALIMAVFYVGDEVPSPADDVADALVGGNVVSLVVAESVAAKPSAVDLLVEEKVPVKAEAKAEVIAVTNEKPQRPSLVSAPESALDAEPNKSFIPAIKIEKKPKLALEKTEPIALQAVKLKPKTPALQVVVASPSNSLPVVIAAAPTAVVSTTPLTNDEQAVMFWPEEAYTLQVMAAGQLPGLEQFVAGQANRNLLRIVAYRRNNAPWYVVLVGVYDSTDKARLAIRSLPKPQFNAKPWPRKISDVQRSITIFRRK